MNRSVQTLAALLFLCACAGAAAKKKDLPDIPYRTVFGWDGNKDAVIAFADGSFFIRDGLNKAVGFGIGKKASSLQWYNAAGYLPCLVTEFDAAPLHIKIMNFGDLVSIDEMNYVIAYSRVQATNNGSTEVIPDPEPSPELIPLSPLSSIGPGETKSFDFAVTTDRFGKHIPLPPPSVIQKHGGWDEHFQHMKSYWDRKLESIAQLQTPRADINNSYKAGYIYTHIIKEGAHLRTGAGEYNQVYDHDANGILAGLFTVGDFQQAREFLDALPEHTHYDDARWNYSWPWALYALKTGDLDYVRNHWDQIHASAHKIAEDRSGPSHLMKKTKDIDAEGFWLADNWTAVTGLLSYAYLCSRLGNRSELAWAHKQYKSLLKEIDHVTHSTMKKYKLGYLPASVIEPNSANRTAIPNDANWATSVAGLWTIWLSGGKISDTLVRHIDATYDYGFRRLAEMGMPPADFGGFPDYSSGYNSFFGAAGLVANRHRDLPIEAYEFMLGNTQSGPFSWWEGIESPAANSIWAGAHPKGGDGDCPHMWGHALNIQAVLGSIVSERLDGQLVIGRGVPEKWLDGGKPVEVDNFPISTNKRINIRIEKKGSGVYELRLSGDYPSSAVIFDLPGFYPRKVKSTTAGAIDRSRDRVILPASIRLVEVRTR